MKLKREWGGNGKTLEVLEFLDQAVLLCLSFWIYITGFTQEFLFHHREFHACLRIGLSPELQRRRIRFGDAIPHADDFFLQVR